MTIEQDFLPFAAGSSANVMTQAAYVALTGIVQNGFVAGIAPSNQLNKVWRQSSIMAAVLAQFIVDETGQPAIDDGTTATLLANLKIAMGGRYLGTQIITSSGTYTPGVYNGITAKSVRVRGCGGGGAGGGAPATGASTIGLATGGISGAYAEFITSAIPTTVTVGAAGAIGAAGAAGGAGGNSAWGTLVTLQGGSGGSVVGPVSPPYAATSSSITTVGGSLTPLVSVNGNNGGLAIGISTTVFISAAGGTCPLGAAGESTQNGTGIPASGYGAGGGGASNGTSLAARIGGAGAPGFFLVDEFA